ncbi:unnamed protein product [Linum trigynum]|uniref:Uncharacterized protein n=1 Tax=Linum trigynum TaxID=586398 RepID=A0AAV2FGG9_9ROSI
MLWETGVLRVVRGGRWERLRWRRDNPRLVLVRLNQGWTEGKKSKRTGRCVVKSSDTRTCLENGGKWGRAAGNWEVRARGIPQWQIRGRRQQCRNARKEFGVQIKEQNRMN